MKAFKWIKINIHATEDFPSREFVNKHFKETLANLTNLYLHGKILPSTKTVKFRASGDGFKATEDLLIPTPITEVNLRVSLHQDFPNAEWVLEHYPKLVRRLASLYIIGTISPTVSNVMFGIPRNKWEEPSPIPKELGQQTFRQLVKSISIEWDISPNNNQEFITEHMGKRRNPLPVIDVKELAKSMKPIIDWEEDEDE